jgi:hypothetical protein
MRPTISALTLSVAALAVPGIGHAEGETPKSVLTTAVVKGSASAPLLDIPQYAKMIQAVQQRTGSSGPLMIYAQRMTSFKDQPRCGRVAYIIAQPSSNMAWSQMGGQLNICDNGDPPWRMCNGDPRKLVPANADCPDHSATADAPEVAAAIQAALDHGGLTPEQALKGLNSNSAAPSPAGVGKGVKQ